MKTKKNKIKKKTVSKKKIFKHITKIKSNFNKHIFGGDGTPKSSQDFNKNIFGGYGTPKSSQDLNKNLIDLVKLFNKYHISNWCIHGGTLLGIVREGNCIDNDDDIDILLHIEELQKLEKMINDNGIYVLMRDIAKKRLEFNLPQGKEYMPFYQIKLPNSNITIDLSIVIPIYDYYKYAYWGKSIDPGKWYLLDEYKPYKKVNWKGVIIQLPKDNKYLYDIYGDDWITPKPRLRTHNLKEFYFIHIKEFFDKKYFKLSRSIEYFEKDNDFIKKEMNFNEFLYFLNSNKTSKKKLFIVIIFNATQ